jgi:hypothetical protein
LCKPFGPSCFAETIATGWVIAGSTQAWPGHRRLGRPRHGTPVVVRPIRPEDEALYGAFFAHVTAELRFFAPVKGFSHTYVARFTQIDCARAMAFVAIDEATGALLGVVRLHSDANYETGEYAILVRSDLKGGGSAGC